MDYKKLTRKQIYTGEVDYTLDDFIKDFRKQAGEDWGSELDNKKNRTKTVYQSILLLIVFASQGKSPKLINEILAGKDTKEMRETLKEITDRYEQEIKILEGLQMKMFLDNLQEYGVSDSLNLKLLNADFRTWLQKALNQKPKGVVEGTKK